MSVKVASEGIKFVLCEHAYMSIQNRVDCTIVVYFFFQAEDGIRDLTVTGVQTCALPISSEDVPISIGVIFDCSGSMSNKLGKAREAAVQFLKTANPLDEFFLVSFNERAELTSDYTNSAQDLQGRMILTTAKGRTALFDAIYLGLSEMRGAHNAKRALLIISDGGDNHSRFGESDIKRLVKEADAQLYAIGMFDSLGYRSRTEEERSEEHTSELQSQSNLVCRLLLEKKKK